jgi:hypothetical protein
LTYHLESLGELVSKMEDGRYKLSSFGEASVITMKGVEETPSRKLGINSLLVRHTISQQDLPRRG